MSAANQNDLLFSAIQSNNLKQLESLLEETKVDINATDDGLNLSQTALIYAVDQENVEMLKLLQKYGFNFSVKLNHYGLCEPTKATLELLEKIEREQPKREESEYSSSSEAGGDARLCDIFGKGSDSDSSSSSSSGKNIIGDYGSIKNKKSKQNNNGLKVKNDETKKDNDNDNDNSEKAKTLADIRREAYNAFLRLCENGNVECLDYLIKNICNKDKNITIDFKSEFGKIVPLNGLGLSVINNRVKMVDYLLNNVFCFNNKDDKKRLNKYVKLACQYGYTEMIELLVKAQKPWLIYQFENKDNNNNNIGTYLNNNNELPYIRGLMHFMQLGIDSGLNKSFDKGDDCFVIIQKMIGEKSMTIDEWRELLHGDTNYLSDASTGVCHLNFNQRNIHSHDYDDTDSDESSKPPSKLIFEESSSEVSSSD